MDDDKLHAAPAEGATCLCCFDDLRHEPGAAGEDEEPINYVEYRTAPSRPWKPSGYCEDCLRHLLSIKYNEYLEAIKKADCGRSLRNMLSVGPPLFMKDSTALPVDEEEEGGGAQVKELWFASSDSVEAAKVDNAVEGLERDQLWLRLIVDNKDRLEDPTSLDDLIGKLQRRVGE